jgi:hypothetical protein
VPASKDSIACRGLLEVKPVAVALCSRVRQVASGWFDPYSIGSCRLGEANDVFNGIEVVTSCRLATSLACAVRHLIVRSLGTVAARLPRVVEPPRIVVTHCERAAGLRCTVVILQSPCPHVLLAFNAPSAARLAGAQHRPCHVVPWKICARPDGKSWWSCRQWIFVYVKSPQPIEPPRDTWQLRSCIEPRGGSWSHGTHGGFGATLSQ